MRKALLIAALSAVVIFGSLSIAGPGECMNLYEEHAAYCEATFVPYSAAWNACIDDAGDLYYNCMEGGF